MIENNSATLCRSTSPSLPLCWHLLIIAFLTPLQIDQSMDFTLGEPTGELNQATADILLGCIEVMMEDLVEEIAGGISRGGWCCAGDCKWGFACRTGLCTLGCMEVVMGDLVEGIARGILLGGRCWDQTRPDSSRACRRCFPLQRAAAAQRPTSWRPAWRRCLGSTGVSLSWRCTAREARRTKSQRG